jgi:tRNA A-37 threonylcarbamoyl transferase component Bud32
MERYESKLDAPQRGGSAVVVPDSVVEALGGNVRARVAGTLNGVEFKSNLMRYSGVVWLGVHKATMQAAGISHGDPVTVEMSLDETPRVVEVPEALEQALAKDTAARAAFEALAFTHRKEYAQWVAEAKKEETRDRRVAETIERLKTGRELR